MACYNQMEFTVITGRDYIKTFLANLRILQVKHPTLTTQKKRWRIGITLRGHNKLHMCNGGSGTGSNQSKNGFRSILSLDAFVTPI